MKTNLAARPSHVPEHLVHDFDFFSPPGGDVDIHLAWKELHSVAPPIFWTPRNGGHWIATRAEHIEVIQTDSARFSNQQFTLPVIPLPFQPLPLGLDPPAHAPIRALIAPGFAPKAVQGLAARARQVAVELIENLAPRGQCEFVGDFAKVLPIVVFLGMMGLPEEDRELLLPWADAVVRTSDPAAKLEAHRRLAQYLNQWIETRTRQPGNDLISKIAHSRVAGRPITSQEVLGLCLLVMLGGLDTVAGMLSFIALYLAERPELQETLTARPEILPAAVEELMRRHGLPNTARMVADDLEYAGVSFAKGDMIQLPRALYNLDEAKIDRPLEVDFDRPTPVPNATFGNGIHKCPGANLARQEIQVFIEEWLKRIPRFALRPGFTKRTMSGGVNGIERVDLVWNLT